MCSGIVGIVNYKENIIDRKPILDKMLKKLEKRNSDENNIYLDNNAILGQKMLKDEKKKNTEQSMSYKYNDTTYTIVYNGNLYNLKELKSFLENKGFEFDTYSDIEVLLKAFVYYGRAVCKYLNGVFGFAIWNDKERELFLARDRFGIKPLYYTISNGNFIFASEIKALLEYPDVEAKLDLNGIGEVFGVGPAHTVRKNSI